MAVERVLVVDDDDAVASSLARSLRVMGGYEVRVETRGGRALDTAHDFRPDLILLDVVMPDVDGSEVAAAIAADPDLREIPLVLVTGLVSREEVGRMSTDSAGRRIVPKPIEPMELLAIVKETLRTERDP